MTFDKEIESIAKKLEIKPATIANFFSLLIQESPSTSDLAYKLRLPRTHLGRLLKSLQPYLEPKSQVVRIDVTHRKVISNFINSNYFIDKIHYKKNISDLFKKISAQRPKPLRELDQFHATIDTILNRSLHLHEMGEVFQRDIVFMGDDDLTSVAVALLNRARTITVIDIDQRILDLIEKISDENRLNIRIVKANFLTDSLSNFANHFDVVFTDPPYTEAGVGLFISRGKTILRKSHASSTYVCYGNSSRAPERIAFVQQEILSHGFIFDEIISNFNQYNGADSIGNGSDLYRLKLINRITKKGHYERIYTHE